ncbi:MAG: SulP family inorganic anion transporter, partial [Phycisphaerae bacterium]|nr:SulP family inorganic anion transporter [Phycisphaerae bacterium]
MIDLIIRRQKNLKNELLSGLTVMLALVPEAVAFAFVAGVDPKVGLWAAFFVGFITSLIGGRPGMISGATGAMAVVMTAFVVLYGLEYLFAAVVLCGIIQILCGVLKVGKFVRLLPHPVMLGFVNGLAIVIGMAQFGQLKENQHVVYNAAAGVFEIAGQWMTGTTLAITAGLIVLTMGIINFLPRLTKAIPGTLVAIIVVTLLVQLTPIEAVTVSDFVKTKNAVAHEKNHKAELFKQIKGDLKVSEVKARGEALAAANMEIPTAEQTREAGRFQIPNIPLSFKSLSIILGLALTLAAIGLIESLMTLTLIDELTETRGNGNRECIGQGVANTVAGLFGSMGGCAMIGQSMINIRSGGRSRLSGIIAAVCLLSVILFPPLWECVGMIPVAALIGVMFIVVIATFEWTSLRLWNRIPKSDLLVIVAVSAMTVIFDLAIAVAAGVIISAIVFAWKKSKQISAKTRDEDGIRTYVLSGPLFFGAVTSFKDIFNPADDPDEVVVEFRNCRVYDHSALEAIHAVSEKYRALGKNARLKHLSKECQTLLKNAGDIIEVDLVDDPDYHIA